MKTKKMTALVLALTVIFSLFSFQFASADVFNSEYKTETEFLKAIGLIDEAYDATLVITKAEISAMILGVLYPDTDFSAATDDGLVFNDVPATHPGYSYIRACRDLGIVKGDNRNNFYPDKQVTLAEAVTMIINALGYTYHADAFGGYPSGYFTVAKQIGILKNIDMSFNDFINGGIAVRLIYNSLFANIIEMASYGPDGFELKVNENKNILNEKFSVSEYDGVVVDNGIVSIDGDSIGDPERAVIRSHQNGNMIKAYINGSDIASYFGMRVKAFVKYNNSEGRNEVLYAAPYKADGIVTVNAKDIIAVNDSYVEYDEDISTPDADKVKLSDKRPVVIYNGAKIIDKPLADLIPDDGFVSFIENSGDSKTDLIMIYSFNYFGGDYNANARNIVADSVITTEGEEGISCLYNPGVSVDLNEEEYFYSFVLSEGIASLSDVKPGMIVSVAECPEKIDGKTYYMLAVSTSAVEGTVVSTEGDDRVYIGDEEYYDISSSVTGIKAAIIKNLKTGTELKMQLDVTGKAAYIKTEADSTKNYGYIVKATRKSQGDEYVLIKFFGKNGEMNTLKLADNAVVDGVKVKGLSTSKKLELITSRPSVASSVDVIRVSGRPAIITVNGDLITKIDTDTPNENLSTGKISDVYVQQSPIQYYEDDAESYETLKAGFRSPRAVTVRGTNKSVGGKFFITSNTVVLKVPEIDTYALKSLVSYKPYGYDNHYLNSAYSPNLDMISYYELPNVDENYSVSSSSQLNASYSLDIQGYDIDPDTGIAGLVIVRGRTDFYRSSNVPNDKPMAVFLEKTDAYDSASEKNVTKIHYYEKGERKSAIIDTDECFYGYKYLIEGCEAGDTPHNVKVEPLKNGDVIRVIQSSGKIVHIERVVKTDDVLEAGGYVLYSQAPSVPYSKSVSGSRSTFPYDMPVTDDYSPEESYVLASGYVSYVKGGTAKFAFAKEFDSKLKDIDISAPSSYSQMFYKVGNNSITVIELSENGKNVKVKQGSFNDITTLEDTGNDSSKASKVIVKLMKYEPEQIIVINNLDNM